MARRVVATREMLAVLGRDPTMRALIAEHGPCSWGIHEPFWSLVRAVVGHQVSNEAARTIHRRLRTRFRRRDALAAASDRALREVGLSGRKADYLRGIARWAIAGGLRGLRDLNNEEIVARLVRLRGVGRWTAEMFLIFSLGRLDVWPVGDLGIVRTAARLYGVHDGELVALGERFRPYRTVAAMYLWLDHEK